MVSGDRGFTLVELLITLTIMFVGLLGLVALQVSAMRAGSLSRGMTEATGLAQDKLEALQRTPYANLSALAPSSPVTETQLGPLGTTVSGPYTRRTSVTLAGAVLTMNVAVSWSDNDGRPHAVRLYSVRTP
jgi:type IV pilus assembly protein PilV